MMKRVWFPLFSGTVLVALMALMLVVFFKQARNGTDQVIVQHLDSLATIFAGIDRECGIRDFEHTKNYIDFLNVISFVGSEVGSMNLIRPHNWKGPYVQDNPTIQEKYYQVVRTTRGHFIVPGEGVRLSNGKVIGKDITIDENSDIESMTRDQEQLASRAGAPLAVKITIGGITGKVEQPLTEV